MVSLALESNAGFNTFTSIDEFEVGAVIGRGSFGTVVVARHKLKGEVFAIKIIQKSKIITRGGYNFVKNEREVLGSLRSTFAAEFFGSFQDEKSLYLVQEFVQGGELFRYLKESGKLTLQQAKTVCAEITQFLEDLHVNGIIYRDLKPENIMISSTGHIKVVDFGFAAYLNKESFTFCGTLDYLSPEMVKKQGHSFEVDWWTLGILLYELLVGYPPFYSKSFFQTSDKILKNDPIFPQEFDCDAQDLIIKLLDKNHKTRMTGKDIKTHPFFKDTNWVEVQKCEISPFYTPEIKNDMDTSNFKSYCKSKHSSSGNTKFSFTGY